MELPTNETKKKQEKSKLQSELEFNTSTQTIQVPYLNLINNSQNIQEEIIKNSFYLFQYYLDKLKDLQKTAKIKEESISTFFLFMNSKDFELKKEEFIDLFKLVDIFKAQSLEKILKQFLIDNSNDVDFIMSLKIEQEKVYSPNMFQNDEFSIVIEECISKNINQFLQNERINEIKISSIYRMIEKNFNNLSADILYHFICKSIKERQCLFHFLDLEKLSAESFEELFMKYTNDIKSEKCHYYDYLPNSIIFIKRLKDKQARSDELNRSQAQKLKQTIAKNETKQKKLKKTITSYENKNEELESKNKILIDENEKLKLKIKELLKRDKLIYEEKIIERNKSFTLINFQTERPKPKQGKFMFFATGSPSILLEGIEVELQLNYTPQQCKDYLQTIIKSKINSNIDDYDLLIYLAGGIPFLNGTLSGFYSHNRVKPYIYGVLIQSIPEEELNKKYKELCDIKLNKLLSPICKSTLKGMCDIACILGYMIHEGPLCEKFLKSCAAAIHFPPFITCLNRIIDQNDITGRDIITVTSTLHTYFCYLLDPCPPTNKIFEYTLKCCNYIINIKNENETIPMDYNEKMDDKLKFLANFTQTQSVYFWEDDSYGDNYFISYNIKQLNIWNRNGKNNFLSFGPILPLSVKYSCGCSIIEGENQNFLCISQSIEKDNENSNKANIIDPTKGLIESVDINEFASLHSKTKIQDVTNFINTEQVQQVIFFCIDCSELMKYSLKGIKDKETQTREIIASQYLACFVDKIHGFRIPCICGLITFNSEINEIYPLTHLSSDYFDIDLEIEQESIQVHLWDAISYACDRLNKFTKRLDGDTIFKKAVNRIIVISAVEDNGSISNIENIAKQTIENKIIIDCILLNNNEKCKELATLCHISGGLAFNPKTIEEGLNIFEKSAFLNINERIKEYNPLIREDRKTKPQFIKVDQINAEFIQKAIKDSNFDTEICDKYIPIINSKFVTPKYVCSINGKIKTQQPRKRRILRELHHAALITDSNSSDYDPNIVILPLASCIEIWQVFIKGEEFTPYNGKWFSINVTFPELYPHEPPIFKFISIPYHLNVSLDGRICMDILNKCYTPSIHVTDIIQNLKELFVWPNIMNSVQIEILETFIDDIERYNEIARKSAQSVGKDDYKLFLPQKVNVLDQVDDEFMLRCQRGEDPIYMPFHISNRHEDPVMAFTGLYTREERKKLLLLDRSPRMPVIHGRPLTEKLEDIDPI